MVYYGTPIAGSYTYNVSLAANSGGGTATIECASTYPAFILVELISIYAILFRFFNIQNILCHLGVLIHHLLLCCLLSIIRILIMLQVI